MRLFRRPQFATVDHGQGIVPATQTQPQTPPRPTVDWQGRALAAQEQVRYLNGELALKRQRLNTAHTDLRKALDRAERADNLSVDLADSREHEKRLQAELAEMRAEADRNRTLAARIEEAETAREELRATALDVVRKAQTRADDAEGKLDAVRAYAEKISRSGHTVYQKAARELLEILDGAPEPGPAAQESSGIVVNIEPSTTRPSAPGPDPAAVRQAMLVRNRIRGGGQ